MDVKELRIGNYVNNGDIIQSLGIMCAVLIANEVKSFSVIRKMSELESIPLTKEWLLKFGFLESKHIKGNLYWGCVSLDKEMFYEVHNTYSIKIEHVHQLQNLYFALTGEELTIKVEA